MTPTEIVKLGSTFANVNAYNPSAGAPPGWEVKPLLSKSDPVTGFQATTFYNAITNQYWFAVAGTNDIKDRSAWNSALSGYSGNKEQVDFALGLMKSVNTGAESQGATVLTSGHSFGGQFTDIGTSVFGWQSVKFDAVGGSSIVNSSGFKDKLAELGITPAGGTNAISCNINGFGPFGGSLVGTVAGSDIPGTVNCKIDLPSGTASNVVSIGLTALFGLPGWAFSKAITTGFQHDAGNINQAVQGGNFTVNGVAPTQPTSFQPYSITDEDGNILRTIQGSDGKPLLDADGKPKLELVLAPPSQGANGQTIQFDSNGRITSVVNLSSAAITNIVNGDQAQPDHYDVLYASNGGDEVNGLDGNDALDGLDGADEIDGGDGDDLIGGGAGSDTMNGGAGNDWIFSALDLTAPARTGPSDVWPPVGQPLPATATILSQGKTWGIYSDLVNNIPSTFLNYVTTGTPDIAPDVIDGGDGDDHIVAGRGADYVTGGLGDDRIYGGGGVDLLQGGVGADYIWGDGLVLGTSYLAVPAEIHGADYLDGGDGNDQLIGQGGDDVLFGGDGDDKLLGDDINETFLLGEFHGDDYLDGGAGSDSLVGGGGNDNLFGGTGDDNLAGDAGKVDLSGAYHGVDFLDGGIGADTLSGGGSGDQLYGGAGNDVMFGDSGINPLFNIEGEFHGIDFLDGGDGDDFMFGDGKNDILIGGAGADILYGDNLTQYVAANFHGNDNLSRGDGNDTEYGGGGNDVLSGGNGDDELQGDDTQGELPGLFHGADTLDGGDGNDRLFGQGGNDNLSGGTGADLLVGDGALIDVPGQFHGNDYLDGGDGNDTLTGGGGNDSLFGGAGDDTLQGDALLVEVPALWHGADYLDGGDGNDLLLGGGGADLLLGGAGIDELQGGDGDDSLSGGSGNDVLFGEAGNNQLDGGDGDDNLYGGAGNDTLDGGAGNDQLVGNAGADILLGGAGADKIYYGDGDLIDGGVGNDSIFSNLPGTANATVLFGRGDGHDSLFWRSSGEAATTVQFKAGVAASDIVSYRSGPSSLVLGIAGTSDYIVISGYSFPDNPQSFGVPQPDIKLFDGSVWTPQFGGMGQFLNDYTDPLNPSYMQGTSSADLLETNSRVRWIEAGAGDDTLLSGFESGPNQQTNYFAGDGNDFISAGLGADRIFGGSGNDTLDGAGGFDVLYGETGSNTYVFGRGYGQTRINAERATGDSGIQTLSLKGLSPGEVELRRIMGSQAGIFSSEWVDSLEIKIKGTTDVLIISGFFLPDNTAGLDFSIDQISFKNGATWNSSNILANLIADATNQTGTAGFELMFGGAGGDTFYGLDGNDSFYAGAGADTMYGGLGDDTYLITDAGDTAVELAGEGTDKVYSSISWTLNDNVENLQLMDIQIPDELYSNGQSVFVSPNLNGTGNGLNNSLAGNRGDNILDGGIGADTMSGGLGNDTYIVDNAGDLVAENADEGIDTVISSITKTLGANLENLTLSGSANINGTGNSTNNVLTGNVANNTLNGGLGADTMKGGAGNDTYTVDDAGDLVVELAAEGTDTVNSAASYTLAVEVENLTLTGSAVIDGIGNALDNTLIGNSASNVLTGGAGNDLYVVGVGDTTAELAGGGTDTVQSAIAWTLAAEVENLTLTGSSAINGNGNGLDNTLTGNSGINILTGGAGNDIYVVGTGDTTIEVAGGGIDTVQSSVTWSLASVAEVENLTLTGTSAINGTGNGLNNVLAGNSAANTLSGAAGDDQYRFNLGGGADRIIETTGNDRIVFGTGITSGQITVTRTGTIVKLIVNGTDSVSIDQISAGVYAVEQFEFADGSVLGASWVTSLLPNAAPTATNLSAAETYTEDTAKNLVDIVVADTDSANLTVTLALSNVAAGSLNVGTSGAVTSTYAAGTGVWSASGAIANVNTLLAALTFTPAANFNGNFTIATSVSDGVAPAVTGIKAFTGTAVNDAPTGAVTITGTAAQGQTLTAANTLADVDGLGAISYQWKAAGVVIAGATASTLLLAAAQVGKVITVTASYTDGKGTAESVASSATVAVAAPPITGTAGADTINGTTGADQMAGLAGNDTYVVNNAGDVVIENLNEGADLVNASVSHTLAPNVENITLTGTSAINATGNGLDNTLTGNSGINVLTGGAGNDLYIVGTGDTTIEALNAGTDSVQSLVAWTLAANVENLTLMGTGAVNGTGNGDANVLIGNSASNTLTGNAGADTLRGLAGADSLVGGTGNDTYWLARGYGIDTITENDTTAGNTDIARFETGIATDQLWFTHVGNNLEVSIIGTSDRFTLTNWYLGNQYHVEQFKTSDGKTLLDSQVQNLVSAMAGFAPPAAGQTTLPANYATTLAPVFAANWV